MPKLIRLSCNREGCSNTFNRVFCAQIVGIVFLVFGTATDRPVYDEFGDLIKSETIAPDIMVLMHVLRSKKGFLVGFLVAYRPRFRPVR